jgi:hypothetical protein
MTHPKAHMFLSIPITNLGKVADNNNKLNCEMNQRPAPSFTRESPATAGTHGFQWYQTLTHPRIPAIRTKLHSLLGISLIQPIRKNTDCQIRRSIILYKPLKNEKNQISEQGN